MDQKLLEQMMMLQKNQQAIKQLMNSQDGQKLLALLQNDGGAKLQQAANQAAKGNTADVVRMIAEVMKTKDGAELVEKISRNIPK